ncbi:sigma 54-interacting transcriptional regulator, partial [Klebsiella pneumoniae]|nr:sigma 54-interacting transcriptional regulator [Klebsiella pneumoniae]
GILPADAPFTVFNCAEYANNPELLTSKLFGHAKGAFTGADKAVPGLIETSNGGVLFIDEVHRLPPEGQEKLFHFMDNGSWRRL